jgi:zinc protease
MEGPVLLLAFVGAALAGGDPLQVEATVHTLDNGLTVVLEEDHRTDHVALHLHYGVGSRDERPGEYGCAHLFEHVMFEGSTNVPANGFDEWLTGAGGWNNAFTSEDETAYYMVFPSGALDLALFLESDRMGFLLEGLTEENLDNQQQVVLQERAEGYAAPNGRDYDALGRLQFPEGHPYHHPVIGTVADVEGFEVEAVRDFWRRHYRPRNAVLGLVGRFETEEVLARVEHWFADVPDPGPRESRAEGAEVAAVPQEGLLEDDVEDWSVYLSWQTVPRGHQDEPALDLLGWILVGGRGTRLDDRLYYKHSLVVDNDAWHAASELDGQFVIEAAAEVPRLPRLQRIVDKELARLVRKPPSEEEVERARRQVKSGVLDSLEQPADRAEWLVDCQRLRGAPDCLVAEWARYEAVTPEDVRRVVETYLVPERRVSLSVVPAGWGGALPGAEPVELP